ncbi:glycosyltransferase family 4 protein [bacterium]|nr:glycosyltransferase family 4 protein [bacterium]
MKIALFTDQGAHYRFPCFRAIESSSPEWGEVDFYIPDSDAGGLHVLKNAVGLKSVRRINNIKIAKRLFYQTEVVRACLSGKYDVVVLWGGINILSTWLGCFLSKLTKTQIVLWGHGYYGNEHHFIATARTLMYRQASGHLLYGDHGLRLLKQSLPNSRAKVIYNSLDVADIRQHVERSYCFKKGEKWDLIFVGRITAVKNLNLLLAACEILKEKGEVLKILVVGEGGLRDSLTQHAIAMGIGDWFDWVGPCYDDQILAGYFKKSKFCISPGNIGLMAMHSLYNETPVITHRDMTAQMPEAEAVVHGVNGFLFNPADSRDMALTISSALRTDYLSMSDQCFESVSEKYIPAEQASVFWELLEELN